MLVFEDLHWADEAMLAFLEHLADRAEARAAARGRHGPPRAVRTPPRLRRRPAQRHARSTSSPLSEEETARLVSALLETTVIPAELQQPILDRAGGNPLYAEEFVRLLKDKDLLVKKGASWELREGAEVPFPDSVQALIAARLDTLSPDTKSMLADAAVIGKVFWAGAIAQMGDRDLDEVTETLRELSRKELVRPARRSSIEGEAEYAFWHVLARDVAYGQLPRASRASRHVAAARWIESKAPERVEDLADVLAYHYATALELARAAGQTEQAAELEAPALRFLTLAGERALGLDTAAALANLERALALTPPGHPERPEALVRFGEAAFQAGRHAEAAEALEEAIAVVRARPATSPPPPVRWATLSQCVRRLGDPRSWTLPGGGSRAARAARALPRARRVRSRRSPSSRRSGGGPRTRSDSPTGRSRSPTSSVSPDPPRALGYRGLARCHLGDPSGLEDFREAIELATEAGQGREVALLHNNLGVARLVFEGPGASLEVLREGIAYAKARGLTASLDFLRASIARCAPRYAASTTRRSTLAAEMAPRLEESGDVFGLTAVRAAQVRILVPARCRLPRSSRLARVARARRPRDRGPAAASSSAWARPPSVRAGLGQDDAATALLAEIESYSRRRETTSTTPTSSPRWCAPP